MTNLKVLTLEEASQVRGGEAITLTIVLTYLAVSILTIVVWKLYTSGKGKIQLPGGFNFEWAPGVYINKFTELLF
jgi:hypothetical protein